MNSPLRPRLQSFAAAAALLLIVAACGSDSDVNAGAGDQPLTPTTVPAAATGDLVGPLWSLVEATTDGSAWSLPPTAEVTFSSDGTAVSGTSACNSYFGTIDISGDALVISQVGGTEMACLDPGIMELEAQFLAALPTMTAAVIADGVLTLSGGETEMRFTQTPEAADRELTSVVWQLDTLVTQEIASTPAAEATIEFTETGISGSTGCNAYSAEGGVVDGRLEVGQLVLTRRACKDAAVSAQESLLVNVLQNTPAVEIDGDTLRLTIDAGDGVVFTAV